MISQASRFLCLTTFSNRARAWRRWQMRLRMQGRMLYTRLLSPEPGAKSMMAVFIVGSRAMSRLNTQITERLDNIMRQEILVLIGDANGADKAVQGYLSKCGYRNVLIHCMEVCRNNVGNWPTRHHGTEPNSKRDRHYYAIKDAVMAQDASCGFMLWMGKARER